MAKKITEKSIRALLSGAHPLARFGATSIRVLLEVIDEQRGSIAMSEAYADEAALLAARQAARIAELEGESETIKTVWHEAMRIAFGVLDGSLELKRRLWEVENFPALADPHLFERLADDMVFDEWKRRDSKRSEK